MFEGITQGLRGALSFIDRGRLTEANIREGLRQVRQALLEADVHYDVATAFIERVTEEAVGERVLKSLRPSEQIVSIVYQELTLLMGGPQNDTSLHLKRDGVTVLMMCGLQGSGKTTTCGKLANLLKDRNISTMLVAADLQRPAAIEQLKVLGQQLGVPVYSEPPAESTPVRVCRNGLKEAEKAGARVLILDTAGRLHIDDALMRELTEIDNKCQPDQVLLVCDAMTGQDAVNSAKAFNEALELDGVILTKLDGDTRGGAALSVKAVTGVPIKFVGVGEQIDKLQEFHPERMADRILGMGDIRTLVEDAQRKFDEDEMLRAQEQLEKGKWTLDDFLKQFKQIKKLGSMGEIMKMIPGLGGLAERLGDMNPDQDLRQIEGIIQSMTPDERRNPGKIDRSRRHRIASGSGSDPADVNKLLKDFDAMSGMMQKIAGMGMMERMRAIKGMADGGMLDPGAQLRKEKQRSKRGPLDTIKAREDKRKKRKEARKQRKRNRK
ncbi:MAG TPA: signal recognition particle protein [Planctomycetaceae bacterium]|nr:signal recognition particle protein [Planctomycetaceae bacterium]